MVSVKFVRYAISGGFGVMASYKCTKKFFGIHGNNFNKKKLKVSTEYYYYFILGKLHGNNLLKLLFIFPAVVKFFTDDLLLLNWSQEKVLM